MAAVLQLKARDERGASAVLVAVMMVALLGFAAVSIDVGRLYWEKAQLQNGADAGALAVASVCGKNETDPQCINPNSLTSGLANANAVDGLTNVRSVIVDTVANRVVVETGALETGTSTNRVSLWFAKVLDPSLASAEVATAATARWGGPSSLTSLFPLAFSQCEVDSSPTFDGELQFLLSHGNGNDKKDTCHSTSSGQELPGGFGWIDQASGGSCEAQTTIGAWATSDTGNNLKSGCPTRLAEWKTVLQKGGKIIALLPVFDKTEGSGNNGRYRIHGYAAVDVRGWNFQSGNDYLPTDAQKVFDDGNYKNSDLGIIGRFTRYVFDEIDGEPGTDGSPYGANIVSLTG
ncbi:TadE/TadG family type IV pilus assembly protein [Arthrobacter halodurans]|uniref:TadE/TadG family type IV pilus assembly protein n=1 Tax=Arthrobacter halodurans TaxID=516699 RepID=A0ABV4UPF9_9MICC